MRIPVRTKARTRQQISRIVSMSAPVRGWNARDALANMKPGDAIKLVNWFPTTTDLVIRGGHTDHVDGLGGIARTLAIYNKADGTAEMYAATDGGIFNASSAGSAGSSVATSTNGYWQWENFGDGTNHWLIMVNGEDKPNYYNGSNWIAVDGQSSPALDASGVASSEFVHVFVHKGRLFFIQRNSLNAWYADALAAGGTLNLLDFGPFAKKGGYLMAGGSWSVDSGDGPDDFAVFVTSEGEVLVYRGNDPSAAEDWSLVGVYELGKPLGRRCLVKYGGDLVLITQNGAFPLSSVLQSAVIDRRLAITDRIETAFNEAARVYGFNAGWEGIVYPARSAMLFNVPTQDGQGAKQYVMNTITKAWCEFCCWDAHCFAIFNGELYFGSDGEVRKAWDGTADGANAIIAEAKEAFQKYGVESRKRLTLWRPILQVNGSLAFLAGLDIDFKDTNIVGEALYTVTDGAQWDVSKWDEAYWAAALEVIKHWQSPNETLGTWFAAKLKVSTNSIEVHWLASEANMEIGQGI
jgi:hypothetical protein